MVPRWAWRLVWWVWIIQGAALMIKCAACDNPLGSFVGAVETIIGFLILTSAELTRRNVCQ
jgi:hypothetical protein